MGRVEGVIPALGWLRGYERSDLPHDLSAGLIVAVILVPQGMAYALLAGLPPIHGLYASIVPAIVYALFGTSRHMPVGPPALMALLTFAGVSAVARPGSEEYLSLALLLALMAGALQLALGLLRMGFLANFIPHPVLSGFIYASVIVIALSQTEHLLGIEVSGPHRVVETVVQILGRLDEVNPYALAVGGGSLAVLALLSRTLPRVPGPLLVVAGGAVVTYLLGLREQGVGIVGEVPGGLPALSVPPLDPETLRVLMPAALTVALVGFVESVSVARAVAARERYKIDSGQELKALGLANVSASFTSGFPVAGSFSRTAVNHQAGAKTQLSAVFAALTVAATLLFLTPLFYYLPNAALAAVIVAAVYKLLDVREARRIFQVGGADAVALVLTFGATLLVGVVEGIIIGTLFALLAFVRRTAYPDVTELGYAEEEDAFLGLRSFPKARTYPGTLVLRFDAPLYYANVPFLEEWLMQEVSDRPDLERVVVDCRGVDTIDITAMKALEELISGYRSRGLGILLAHVKLPVRERLEKAGWEERFGEIVYPTVRDAIQEHDVGGVAGR